jgi:hypothetical protein
MNLIINLRRAIRVGIGCVNRYIFFGLTNTLGGAILSILS